MSYFVTQVKGKMRQDLVSNLIVGIKTKYPTCLLGVVAGLFFLCEISCNGFQENRFF